MFNLQARWQPWYFEKYLAHLEDNPWCAVRQLDSEQDSVNLLEVLPRHNPASEYKVVPLTS